MCGETVLSPADCSRSNFLPVHYGDKSTGTAASLDVLWSVLTLGGVWAVARTMVPRSKGECFSVEGEMPGEVSPFRRL
jgi:hypothetical protein